MTHINSHVRRTWQLTHSARKAPVTILAEAVTTLIPDAGYGGYIHVDVTYDDPNYPNPTAPPRLLRVVKEDISGGGVSSPHISVTDFNLPPCLRQSGIGTFIWSAVFQARRPY